jgi:alpha-beta hydrolase superfamily lysophospholipase
LSRGRAAWLSASWLLAASGLLAGPAAAAGPSSDRLVIRGCSQTLHLYGEPGGPVAIVSSGDGGWVHLGPEVASFLAHQGYFVVGFDAKAYLAGFTSRAGPLSPQDVQRDYALLVDYAARVGRGQPLLVGVSEGAGLSVLASTAPSVKAAVAGVVALGLPDRNELGWRLRDSVIYFSKKTPREPTFSAQALVGELAPLPFAALHATHDEFAPVNEIVAILHQARAPKRLFLIEADNHRFGGNQQELWRRLDEAIAWIRSTRYTASG